MWDWIDYQEEENKEQDFKLDFKPVTRTKDPLAGDEPVEVDSESDSEEGDLYPDEDALFEKKVKTYQKDAEAAVGFPEEKQEYESSPCMDDVLEEYESHTKGKALKPIKKGIGIMLHGDPKFFDETQVDG
ncbi:unnamed protein product [Moneuplotes crassus]|uniref:Uncharacterized protein n=1 Tax=Euplotes crassus TaxID=5936 RepID=A0AAD2D7M1_EUPCR|nr:unnamed protein product [Moneuplotes crassus]